VIPAIYGLVKQSGLSSDKPTVLKQAQPVTL
jgi:hypothetical protein